MECALTGIRPTSHVLAGLSSYLPRSFACGCPALLLYSEDVNFDAFARDL